MKALEERLSSWILLILCIFGGETTHEPHIYHHTWLQSKYFSLIVWSCNIFGIIITPFYIRFASRNFPLASMSHLYLSKYVHLAKVTIRVINYACSLLRTRQRGRAFQNIYKRLALLDNEYFNKYNFGNKKPCWLWTYIMMAIMVLYHLTVVVYIWNWLTLSSWDSTASALLFILSDHKEYINLLLFSRTLWNIFLRVEILNANLKMVLHQSNLLYTERLHRELWRLAQVQDQLVVIYKCSIKTCRYEIFLMKFRTFLSNVGRAFFFTYLLMHGLTSNHSDVILICGCLTIVATLSCNYVFDFICEQTCTSFDQTLHLLNTELRCNRANFNRTANIFAMGMQLQCYDVHIFGIFKINRQFTFALIQQIVTYAIILVQCDYIKLYFSN